MFPLLCPIYPVPTLPVITVSTFYVFFRPLQAIVFLPFHKRVAYLFTLFCLLVLLFLSHNSISWTSFPIGMYRVHCSFLQLSLFRLQAMQQGNNLVHISFHTFTSVPVGQIPRKRISGVKGILIYNFDITKLTSIEIVPVYMPQVTYENPDLNFQLFSKMTTLGFLTYGTTASMWLAPQQLGPHSPLWTAHYELRKIPQLRPILLRSTSLSLLLQHSLPEVGNFQP